MARGLAALLAITALPAFAANPAVTINVDVNIGRHPISPLIYGVAHSNEGDLSELNVPLNRNGGNAATRYNWKLNAANRGSDWYFESLPYSSSAPGGEVDEFIASSRAGGAEPLLTVPILGWVGRLGADRSRLSSFSIAKYGAQTDSDVQWFPDAGNGIRSGGQYVTNDPNDASLVSDPTFQKGWVSHLLSRWGSPSAGGVRHYIMDNEPSFWHGTHRDVHPTGATMKEVRDKLLSYAAMVKDTAPGALVLGPEEWGWSGYLYSGYDQQWSAAHEWREFPDRDANGGWEYLPWLLNQFRQNEQATGRRLLDVFTVHYYPQGGEFSTDVSSTMQLRRNRSTRSLWDPNYTDESWINSQVMLIPRMRNWVQRYYPGTKIGITEYNWGAESHINGATAQADILGLFGREGLDYGIRWESPASSTPTFKAMKLYRNYDGQKSTFGDVSVSCSVPNPDTLSAFAAERSIDKALTVMVINKVLSGDTPVTLNMPGVLHGGYTQRWQLTSANAITRLADVRFSGSSVATTVPPQSITLFVVPTSSVGNQPPVASLTATPTSGMAPLNVQFSAAGSMDPDGSIVSYSWIFGDGQTGTGSTISHIYTQPGTFTARLTVTDNAGATASASVVITALAATLPAPSNFYAQASGSSVMLKWKDNSSTEDGFIIERAPEVWPPVFTEIGRSGANVNSYLDTKVAPGSYIYRVKAFKGAASSGYSNQDMVTVR